MDKYHKIVWEDTNDILASPVPWDMFRDKSVLITGANGSIATYLVYTLLALNTHRHYGIRIFGLVRNENRALVIFSDILDRADFSLIVQDVCEPVNIDEPIDYIIHAASNTSPVGFIEHPLDVLNSNMLGTKLLLELALKKRSISFLYISSVSVYGHSQSKALKKETDFSGIDCMDIRNSYIESKRMGEMTCVAYYTQYGVPVTCIRPATVLVPEFYSGEKGHVTEFARTMADKKNIILNSNGLSFRTYIPICDTIEAVFMTLLKGLRGKAYNIAHRTYVFSMLEMAELFIRVSGNNYNKIIIADQVQDSKLREHHFCIDGMNLELLGWQPISNIEKAIHNMIEVIKHE